MIRGRALAVFSLAFALALLFGAAAGQSTSRTSVTVWIDWTGKASSYSRLEPVSGTVNRAGSTSTSDVSWHNVAAISVPTPLPPPDKPNLVAFLSLAGMTRDSYLQETNRLCIDGQACTTTGFVHTGDRAGISGSAVSSYPDPVGSRSVTWEAQLYGLFNFGCTSGKAAEVAQNSSTQTWATPTRQIDLGRIATGPAQGDQWSFSPAPLVGSNPAFPCKFRYAWSGTLRISREKPAAVTVPAAPSASPPSTTGNTLGKLRAKLAARENLLDILPDAALWCGEAAVGVGAVTVGSAGGLAVGIAVAGATAFNATAEICLPFAKMIAYDIMVIDDPPLGRIHTVAKPEAIRPAGGAGACPHWQGQSQGFCAAWSSARRGLSTAASRLEAVYAAMATTIGRESTAIKKKDEAAVTLQDRALLKLTAQAKAATATYRSAAAQLAAVLRSAGFRISMSASQSARAIAALLARLAKRGVSRQELESAAGAALAPHARDVLALLAGKSPSARTTAPPTKSSITSITFQGDPTNPSFVVHGTNLGAKPKPDPPVHPLGTSGCPVKIQGGDDGYDYGTSLYVAVPAKNWSGGRYQPSLNETDCIDLVVTTFTATEVDFHFGRSYVSFYPKFSLANGDEVQVAVNDATKTVHVKYGATVSS